jgi:hypothetical protein
MFSITYRCVAVTQDAILCAGEQQAIGRCQPQVAGGHVAAADLAWPGVWSVGQVYLVGERHWVHKRFQQDVTAGDYEGGCTRSTTPR